MGEDYKKPLAVFISDAIYNCGYDCGYEGQFRSSISPSTDEIEIYRRKRLRNLWKLLRVSGDEKLLGTLLLHGEEVDGSGKYILEISDGVREFRKIIGLVENALKAHGSERSLEVRANEKLEESGDLHFE